MKFLVAIDGSEPSERALDYTLDLGDRLDASVTVVTAVQPQVYEESVSEPVRSLSEAERTVILENVDAAEERAEDLLADAAATAGDRGQDVDTELLFGDPVVAVTDYAEAHEFDAIYVGHRGLSHRAESALGSVAKEIVARSTVPVTVVR
ncbi:universal stress protein [Halobacteriaceae archaeon GCM10025711]